MSSYDLYKLESDVLNALNWKIVTSTYENWLDIYLTQILPEYEMPNSDQNETPNLECNEVLKDINFV